jgi:arylsulfatase A-like enzyme
MTKLAELGIADNTILCYTSDHGDMLGSFDLWGKRRPWEESINVPFVARWPGHIPAGVRLDHLFSTPDIAPTLLGLAAVPGLSAMQGLDLSAALRGKDAPGPESAFIMASGGIPKAAEDRAKDGGGKQASKPGGKKEWRGVRSARYTYARIQGDKDATPWALYDNEKDPFQMRNLVEEPASAGILKKLDAMVDAWRKRLGEA